MLPVLGIMNGGNSRIISLVLIKNKIMMPIKEKNIIAIK